MNSQQLITAMLAALGVVGGIFTGWATLRNANSTSEKTATDILGDTLTRLDERQARLEAKLDLTEAEAAEANQRAEEALRRLSDITHDLAAAIAHIQQLHEFLDAGAQGTRPSKPWRVRHILDNVGPMDDMDHTQPVPRPKGVMGHAPPLPYQ